MGVNLTGTTFNAQSHDARHEECNKRAQNMFDGKDIQDLNLAFRIVDDMYALRGNTLNDVGLFDHNLDRS